ncbi:hypothetical protein ES703_19320 [subsurface metagenome]
MINSVRTLPEDRLLPLRPYAIEGYCPVCAGDVEEGSNEDQQLLFGGIEKTKIKRSSPDHQCLISKNNGKFFKKITPADLARYKKACEIWEEEKVDLPYPKQKVTWGEKTKSGLIAHHYLCWHQMFNPRQLLCLSTLLKAIDEEPSQSLKELFLSALFNLLNTMSNFTTYIWQRDCTRHVFVRHDFAPKNTSCESSVWGTEMGMGNFNSYFHAVVNGIDFAKSTSDRCFTGRFDKKGKPILTDFQSGETVCSNSGRVCLTSADSKRLNSLVSDDQAHLVVTDPPYASNVNYSELADYFYVWLRFALSKSYPSFAPGLTPKVDEIIENPTRGRSAVDFEEGLKEVFAQSAKKIYDDGLMVFTFHHAQGSAWEALLKAVCDAGFVVDSVYPIHGEAEASLHLLDKKAISYDLIHVCRKREVGAEAQRRSWAGIRQEVRRRAREEIKAIEAGRYGREPLSPADVNIILIGKCFELYSRHYGVVVDHESKEVKLKDALEEIRMMVDQLVTTKQPLPTELSDIDPESYVYLTCLCDRKEVKSDDVHKATRGILEPDSLIKAGIMTKGRAGRGRSYEVKQPRDRFELIAEKFKDTTPAQQNIFGETESPRVKGKVYFIDYIHFLMAVVEGGDNAVPWLERFRGETPRIRAMCEYMASRNKGFAPTLKKILDLIDVGPLFITE